MSRITLPTHLMAKLQKEGKIVTQGKSHPVNVGQDKPLKRSKIIQRNTTMPEGGKVEKSSSDIVQWFLAGKPVPKGRPRFSLDWDIVYEAIRSNNIKDIAKAVRITTPQKTRDYEKKVSQISQKATPETFGAKTYSVHADFFLKNPLKADVDNLLKAIMDGMNEIVYNDDRYCVAVSARKYQASSKWPEGIRVRVTPEDVEEGQPFE